MPPIFFPRRLMLACLLTLSVWLGGCATCAPSPGSAAPVLDATAVLLRLPPGALGQSLVLQQRLTVTARGRTRELDMLLEAEPEAVRLALMSGGQTAARIAWDGLRLTQTRAPWLPQAVSAERVLSDLQLVLWPADAIRGALPEGWSLQADGAGRILRQGSEDVVAVRYPAPGRAELLQQREGYRLVIESRPVEALP